jgi:hypothetical protein
MTLMIEEQQLTSELMEENIASLRTTLPKW